jgi:hypothetical protein
VTTTAPAPVSTSRLAASSTERPGFQAARSSSEAFTTSLDRTSASIRERTPSSSGTAFGRALMS